MLKAIGCVSFMTHQTTHGTPNDRPVLLNNLRPVRNADALEDGSLPMI
jgi:hypothetical protein